MPNVVVKGNKCTPHQDFPPASLVQSAKTVSAEGVLVGVEGNQLALHACTCGKHDPHQDKVQKGEPSVTAEGIPIAYHGCPVDHGNTMIGTCSTVTVG